MKNETSNETTGYILKESTNSFHDFLGNLSTPYPGVAC
jgi:hypothetical protein